MKWGMLPDFPAREFWKSLKLPGEWVEGELDDLLKAQVSGIFLDPAQSETYIKKSHQISRIVSESRFVDFIEVKSGKMRPVAYLHEHGSELLTLGQRSLPTNLRAYITGTGPWSRVFALLAVEKGFSDVQFVVRDPGEAESMIQDLRKFCFQVKIDAIPHADLTLQPNNGALLVNTLFNESHPEITEDLAYLNYLSPSALVIEVHESLKPNPLLEEARHSQLAYLDGSTTQAFFEYHALEPVKAGLSWPDYQRKRQEYRNSPSVQ